MANTTLSAVPTFWVRIVAPLAFPAGSRAAPPLLGCSWLARGAAGGWRRLGRLVRGLPVAPTLVAAGRHPCAVSLTHRPPCADRVSGPRRVGAGAPRRSPDGRIALFLRQVVPVGGIGMNTPAGAGFGLAIGPQAAVGYSSKKSRSTRFNSYGWPMGRAPTPYSNMRLVESQPLISTMRCSDLADVRPVRRPKTWKSDSVPRARGMLPGERPKRRHLHRRPIPPVLSHRWPARRSFEAEAIFLDHPIDATVAGLAHRLPGVLLRSSVPMATRS